MNPPLIVIGGGKGTRMANFMPNTPKLLLPLSNDETILSRIVHEIAASRYFFALGKDANKIINILKTFNIDHQISIEDKPLGTFGALKLIVHKYHHLMPTQVLVILGDLVCTEFRDYQLKALKNFKKADGNFFFYTKNNHPHDSDRIEVDKNERVTLLIKKNENSSQTFINKTVSGIYYLNVRDILSSKITSGDIILDYLPTLISNNNAYAKQLLCNLNDIGSPERYKKLVSTELYLVKRKYLLIDLDGTLIKDRGSSKAAYDTKPELNSESINIIKECNKKRIKVIVITNQGDIAKGFKTKKYFLDEVKYIEEELWHHKAWFDDIYYCPHYPKKGFDGEVKALKIDCKCRKPDIGMWNSCKNKWSASTKNTVFLGDTNTDKEFANKAQIKYFDINNNKDIKSLYEFIGD